MTLALSLALAPVAYAPTKLTAAQVAEAVRQGAKAVRVNVTDADVKGLVHIARLESDYRLHLWGGTRNKMYGLWQINTLVHKIKTPMSAVQQAAWAVGYAKGRYGSGARAYEKRVASRVGKRGYRGW